MVLFCLLSGCSSIVDSRSQKRPFVEPYYSGQPPQAAALISAKAADRKNTGDELMWRLDEGTILFDAGEYRKSIAAFDRAEELIKSYDQRALLSVRDIGAEAGSAVTNPAALPYRGFYYDRIFLNIYKAMAYMALHDKDGTLVEIRRMRETQKSVETKFKAEISRAQKEIDAASAENRNRLQRAGVASGDITFGSLMQNAPVKEAYDNSLNNANKLYGSLVNPFGLYLSAIGCMMERNYSEAMVDYRKLYQIAPGNPLIARDYVTCAKLAGDKIPTELAGVGPYNHLMNRGVVYVIFANGRGPALREVKFQIILPYVGYTGFAFPAYEQFKPAISRLDIATGPYLGGSPYSTVTVADVDAIAAREYHDRMPVMVTRIAVSTLTKELLSQGAVQAARGGHKHQNRNDNQMMEFLAYIITGLFKYTFNTADTRCWETLPANIQVAHLPVPPGGILKVIPVFSGNILDAALHTAVNPVGSFEVKIPNTSGITVLYVRSSADRVLTYKVFELN